MHYNLLFVVVRLGVVDFESAWRWCRGKDWRCTQWNRLWYSQQGKIIIRWSSTVFFDSLNVSLLFHFVIQSYLLRYLSMILSIFEKFKSPDGSLFVIFYSLTFFLFMADLMIFWIEICLEMCNFDIINFLSWHYNSPLIVASCQLWLGAGPEEVSGDVQREYEHCTGTRNGEIQQVNCFVFYVIHRRDSYLLFNKIFNLFVRLLLVATWSPIDWSQLFTWH